MAQANLRPSLILSNPAPPAVQNSRAVQAQSHRSAVRVHQAHIELTTKLLALKPHRIADGRARYEDIEERGEHLQHVLEAVRSYFHDILVDTNENVGMGEIDEKYLENFLDDLISETTGLFARSAETVDEDLRACRGGSI